MKWLVPLILSIFFFSCKGKDDVPRDILEPEKMQLVFWDFIRTNIYTTDYIQKDSSKNAIIENLKLQEKLFKLHNITREQFYKSLAYYSNHKELMKMMTDSMVARQQRLIVKDTPAIKAVADSL